VIATQHHSSALSELAGAHLAILNWRDDLHPDAGGSELYAHRNAELLTAAGVKVSFLTSRPRDLARLEDFDGVTIERRGGDYSVYPLTLARLLRADFDVILDVQNGIPFLAPLATKIPVLPLVHHVHQAQFDVLPAPLAMVGRALEGRIGPRVYGSRPVACVSHSTARGVRELGYRGPILWTPNGVEVTDPAAPKQPTHVVSVNRFVDHKRVDLALAAWRIVASARPELVLDLVGTGPLFEQLRASAADLVASGRVVFHGQVDSATRDRLVSQARLSLTASHHEGWGAVALESAACGVPMVGFAVDGLRDSIVDGSTGWLAPADGDAPELAAALLAALAELDDPARRSAIDTACRERAASFTWERSAEALAGALLCATGAHSPSAEELAL